MNQTAVETIAKEAETAAPEEVYTGHPVTLSRRPVRNKVINNDDILNLRIALETSKTWEEFLSVCQTIKDAGIIPLANSLGDEWDIAEVVFMSLAPNFIGGREGRLAYAI